MKHLKFDKPVDHLALEGLADGVKGKFDLLKQKLFHRQDVTHEDLGLAEKAALELKVCLTNLKKQVSAAQFTTVAGKPARGLHMLGFNAQDPQALISYLKNFEIELNKTIEEERKNVDSAKKDPTAAKAELEKNKSLTAQTEQKQPVNAAEMTLTKAQVVELLNIGINYVDSFLNHKRRVDSIAMEDISNEGIFDSIFQIIVGVIGVVVMHVLTVAFIILVILVAFHFPFHFIGFVVGYKLTEFLIWKAKNSDDSEELESMKFGVAGL